MINEKLIEIQKKIPKEAGVYIFYKNETPIYIGKAKNLYKRTQQYFNINNISFRIRNMVLEANNLKYHITDSENEAFLLEAQLIKQNQPIYNILYKQGRSLYYINITKEKYPKIEIKHEYKENAIGPFLSYNFLNELLKKLLEIFKIRTCSNKNFESRKRPCLEYYINRCTAPCVNLITEIEYQIQIEKINDFFNGKTEKILKILKKEQEEAIKEEKFEKALEKQKIIENLKILKEEQTIVFPKLKNIDCIAYNRENLYIESLREGKISNVKLITFNKEINLEDMIFEIYAENEEEKIIGPEIEIKIKNYTSKLTKNEQEFQNAVNKRFFHLIKEKINKEELMKILKVEKLDVIEIYDSSHYSSKHAYCAMAVSSFEKPLKNLYRKWKMPIRTYNDLEILENGLLKRLEKQNWPDLIILDGGKTQLNVAKKILPIKNIIAFAKGPNRKGGIVYNYEGKEIEIKEESFMFWLENLRTLAHNYAKSCSQTKINNL